MTVSAAMIAHLESNVTFITELWKMTAADGTVIAFADHTRDITYNSQLYKAKPVSPTTATRKIGLQPDAAELTGALDDVITEADIIGGKWKRARIVKESVNYLDLTMGSVGKESGFAGEFKIRNGQFSVEFLSLSNLLHQEIGELTIPTDRNRTPEALGVSMAAFTFARTVTAFADRRNFTVGGAAQVDNYFQYGRAEWVTGANAGLKMEIKSNTGNVIQLQLSMRSNIAIGDTLNLIAGYNGTREQARDKFGATAVLNFNGEPDMPDGKKTLRYPE